MDSTSLANKCSFCSHSAPRVARLVSGPHVFICQGCVLAAAYAAERAHLRATYGLLYDELESLLFRFDPMGLNDEVNTDEYGPEVRKILPRLERCTAVDDVTDLLLEVFTQMSDPLEAGPRSIYEHIAPEVWNLWATRRTPKS